MGENQKHDVEMSEKDKKNKLIKEEIKPLIKAAGYKSVGTNFYSERKKCYVVMYIQNSIFNGSMGYSFEFHIGAIDKSEVQDLKEVKQWRGDFSSIHESPFLPDCGYLHPYHDVLGYRIGGLYHFQPLVTDYEDAAKRITSDIKQYILPRLAKIGCVEEWNQIKKEVLQGYSQKKVRLLGFYSSTAMLSICEENKRHIKESIKRMELTRSDILENTNLLHELLKYQNGSEKQIITYLTKILDEMEQD